MDIDLGKFFETVPQDRLMSLLHNIIEMEVRHPCFVSIFIRVRLSMVSVIKR